MMDRARRVSLQAAAADAAGSACYGYSLQYLMLFDALLYQTLLLLLLLLLVIGVPAVILQREEQ